MNVPKAIAGQERDGRQRMDVFKKLAQANLVELYDEEFLYDHPLLHELLVQLIDRYSSNGTLAIIFDCIQWTDTCEHRSLGFYVASTIFQRHRD